MRIEELMIVVIAADVLQGSHYVEESLPSKCAPAVGSDDGEEALRNGFRMDGQWEHQRVHRGK